MLCVPWFGYVWVALAVKVLLLSQKNGSAEEHLFFQHVVSPSIRVMRFFTAMNAVHWTAWLPRHAHNRLETVVEKEIKQSPQQRMSAEGMDPNSMEACGRGAGINDTLGPQDSTGLGWSWVQVLAIKHMTRKPQEKCGASGQFDAGKRCW